MAQFGEGQWKHLIPCYVTEGLDQYAMMMMMMTMMVCGICYDEGSTTFQKQSWPLPLGNQRKDYLYTWEGTYYIIAFLHVTFSCALRITFPFSSHRALKTRGNTPKYGLIFHSTYIGRAGVKNKGRISRFLANKCSIASRLDCFCGK